MKILVVDDEIEICNVVYDFFIRKGCTVIKATDGKEAIEKVKAEKPDLVFLDIRMNKMDGLEALKQIRSFNKKVNIVMATVLNDEDTAKTAIKLGASDYVTKPLSFDYLEKIVTLTELKLSDDKSNK